jgi:oligopeptidase B
VKRCGETAMDDYAWLRERDNPEVMAYLEAENAHTEARTAHRKGVEEALYGEILGRIQQTDLSVPVRRDGYWYYSRTEEGKQYPIHCRRRGARTGAEAGAAAGASPMEGTEEVLLDLNELAAGHSFLGLGAVQVSDDGNRLAYTIDTSGMRRYRLQVKDLPSGQLLADTAERVTSVEWVSGSGEALWFTTEDETTKRSDRLWRLRLGGKAEEAYYEPDELYHMGLGRTRDRLWMLLGIGATDSTEYRYWPAAEAEAAPRVFWPRQRDHKYELDHRAGLFYIRTNWQAKNYRLMTAPVATPGREHWREVIAHRADVLLDGLDLFQDYAVVTEQFEGLGRLRVYAFATGAWREIAFPEPVYDLGPGTNPEYAAASFRYQYQSPVTPPSVFDYDFADGGSTLLKQQAVLGGYEPERYACARLWVTARDGERVPLSAAWRKDRGREAPGPLLLYGYGAYGYGLSAGFSSLRLSLLDRGVAYVIAHVRGGNEMGERWHDAGMLMQKKNTFYDFIDAAEHLIAEGWTRPEQLAIEGGSAGGLLIGAVVNLRPELFRAAHLAVPFVDVMNTMCDASLPLTVGEYLEWGDPRERAAYEYMRSYSPYDNLERKPYPAMLVTTSLNDSQVMYWEPAKYVAKLRALNPEADVLLKTNLGAGHGGASGRYDRLREAAFEYAWMLERLGVDR